MPAHPAPLPLLQVLSLNGTKVINMAQLVELVDSCTEPFLHFHLDYEQKVGARRGRCEHQAG
jgi:hypothetical protein